MHTAERTYVIIDTDPGVDDIIAILLALASPELEILAYIISFGNTDLDSSHLNILKAFEAISQEIALSPSHESRFPNFSGSSKPILARGPSRPLQGDIHSAEYFHGRDGLGDITVRHPELNMPEPYERSNHPQLQITERSGVDVALELLRCYPARSITYIALGPLTNLAQMMREDRRLVCEKIGRVVCMGGALDVPGNITPVAEFNFFADPYAVKELLVADDHTEGIPLERFLLLPLDITTSHELPFPIYKEVVDPLFDSAKLPSTSFGKSPLVHFTSSFLEQTREVMLKYGKDAMELHDIVAVWCAINVPPAMGETVLPPGWEAGVRVFDIERTGEITRGMLVVDRREDESAYVPGANRADQALLEKENSTNPGGHLGLTAVPVLDVEPLGSNSRGKGVRCVVKTTGAHTMLSLLLERVWGKKLNQ
ncbi:nucleoside hydrolase [Infundibulicybe gibba]|nr:nucleoside hydrolase [Infundibulicybe gibba]